MSGPRIAVLRCERLPRFVTWEIPDVESLYADDHRLLEAFAARGVDARSVAWNDTEVDWTAFDGAMPRSTWDYVDHLDEFLDVMAAIDRTSTLVNPYAAVRWNADKHYLDDLADLGVPTVPLVRGNADDGPSLKELVEEAGWRDLVLKPAVGVGGSGVVHTNTEGLEQALGALAAGTDVLVQPFARSIVDEGEWSYVFLGGRLSHVLRKRPAAGDFRAHGIYGGTIERAEPDPGDARAVATILDQVPFEIDYARIDVVRFDGRPAVLELELIEPNLSLDLAPGSADRLAEAVIRRVTGA